MKKHLANLASLVLALGVAAFVFVPAGHPAASASRVSGGCYLISTDVGYPPAYCAMPVERRHIPSTFAQGRMMANTPSALTSALAFCALQIQNQENITR